MQANAIVEHALVDALHSVLEGTRTAHLVGTVSEGARERLARIFPGGLSTAERAHPSPARHEAVIVLDAQRLDEGLAAASPDGILAVVAVNPGYGKFLLEILEGAHPSSGRAAELESVCARLDADGWAVEDATPVAVPLALIPFDPGRIPKTVLAYLYARHPDIETYCFLVRARRTGARVRELRPRGASPVFLPTLPWKTEVEWREEAKHQATALTFGLAHSAGPGSGTDEATHFPPGGLLAADALKDVRGTLEALHRALMRSDEELLLIKSSLTWRAMVKFRTTCERLLPPHTWRGGLYDGALSTIRRLTSGRR